jgi:hypothetical protein
VYVLVAWSDGHGSSAERRAFDAARGQTIPALQLVEDRMEEAAMAGLLEMYFTEEMVEEYRTKPEASLLKRIRRARKLVASKGSSEVLSRYESQMNVVAREVAEASRSLIVFGAKVSRPEQAMLDRVAAALAGS